MGGHMIMEWTADFELGIGFQDCDHREFVSLLNAAASADDENFPGLVRQLIEHTGEHFARENALMRDCAFFAMHCHEAEHERVLNDMAKIVTSLEQGDLEPVRLYVGRSLPEWFLEHLSTMDRVTAQYCKERVQE